MQLMVEDPDTLIHRTYGRQGADKMLAHAKEVGARGVRILILRDVRMRDYEIRPGPEPVACADLESPAPPPEEICPYLPYDRAIRHVLANGLVPYVTLGYKSKVFDQNEANLLPVPSNGQYAQWVSWITRRYRVGDADPLSVGLYSLWNEPNHPGVGGANSGEKLPPLTYRGLFRAGYDAIKGVYAGEDWKPFVFLGELSGGSARNTGGNAGRYLRLVLCANKMWQLELDQPCSQGPTFEADGLAVHPYQYTLDPRQQLSDEPEPNDPEGANFKGIGRITNYTSRMKWAFRGGDPRQVPPGPRVVQTSYGTYLPVLITEFGYCHEWGECPKQYPNREDAPKDQSGQPIECPEPETDENCTHSLTEATRTFWIYEAWNWADEKEVIVFSYYDFYFYPEYTADCPRPTADQPCGPNPHTGEPGPFRPLWDMGIADPDGLRLPAMSLRNAVRS